MRSIKDSKIAKLIGGKGAYITLAAVVLAAGGAGAAAYGKAVKNAEKSFDYSFSQSGLSSLSDSAAQADNKQSGVAKDSSSPSRAEDPDEKTQPNVMPVNGDILEPFSGGELVKSETLNVWKTHDGVDISAEAGTPVKAMNKGEVTQVEKDALWGYTVIIDHGSGVMGYYYNLSSAVSVKEGDKGAVGAGYRRGRRNCRDRGGERPAPALRAEKKRRVDRPRFVHRPLREQVTKKDRLSTGLFLCLYVCITFPD